jgi:hypothetical protein
MSCLTGEIVLMEELNNGFFSFDILVWKKELGLINSASETISRISTNKINPLIKQPK